MRSLKTLESRQLLASLVVPIPGISQEIVDKVVDWTACMVGTRLHSPITDAAFCLAKPISDSIAYSCLAGGHSKQPSHL